jgi:hypothetical protein
MPAIRVSNEPSPLEVWMHQYSELGLILHALSEEGQSESDGW